MPPSVASTSSNTANRRGGAGVSVQVKRKRPQNAQGSQGSTRRLRTGVPPRPVTAGQTITLSDSETEEDDSGAEEQEQEDSDDGEGDVAGTSSGSARPQRTTSSRRSRRLSSSATEQSDDDDVETTTRGTSRRSEPRASARTATASSSPLPPPLVAPATARRARGSAAASLAIEGQPRPRAAAVAANKALERVRDPDDRRRKSGAGGEPVTTDSEDEVTPSAASAVPSKSSVLQKGRSSQRKKTKKEGFAGTALLGGDDSLMSTGSEIEFVSTGKEGDIPTHALDSFSPSKECITIVKKVVEPYDLDDELGCAICYEIMVSPMGLSCYHAFCQACIEPWLADHNNECPTCREVSAIQPKRDMRTDAIITKHMEVVYRNLEQQGKKAEADAARKERAKLVKDAEARRVKAIQDRQRAAAAAAATQARQQAAAAALMNRMPAGINFGGWAGGARAMMERMAGPGPGQQGPAAIAAAMAGGGRQGPMNAAQRARFIAHMMNGPQAAAYRQEAERTGMTVQEYIEAVYL